MSRSVNQRKRKRTNRSQSNNADDSLLLLPEEAILHFILVDDFNINRSTSLDTMNTFSRMINYRSVGVSAPLMLLEKTPISDNIGEHVTKHLTQILYVHNEERYRTKWSTRYIRPNFLTVRLAVIWHSIPVSDFLYRIVPCFLPIRRIRRIRNMDPSVSTTVNDDMREAIINYDTYYAIQYIAVMRKKLLDNFDLLRAHDYAQLRKLFNMAVENEHFRIAALLSFFVDRKTIDDAIDRYMEYIHNDELVCLSANGFYEMIDLLTFLRGNAKCISLRCKSFHCTCSNEPNTRNSYRQMCNLVTYELFRNEISLFRISTFYFIREYGIIYNSLCMPEYDTIVREFFRRIVDSYLIAISKSYATILLRTVTTTTSDYDITNNDDYESMSTLLNLCTTNANQATILQQIYTSAYENNCHLSRLLLLCKKFISSSYLQPLYFNNFWSMLKLLKISVSVPLQLLTMKGYYTSSELIHDHFQSVLMFYKSEINTMGERDIKRKSYTPPNFLDDKLIPFWKQIQIERFIDHILPVILTLPHHRPSVHRVRSKLCILFERYNTIQFFRILCDRLFDVTSYICIDDSCKLSEHLEKLFIRAVCHRYFHLALPLSFFISSERIECCIARVTQTTWRWRRTTNNNNCSFVDLHTVFDFLHKIRAIKVPKCKCNLSSHRRDLLSQYASIVFRHFDNTGTEWNDICRNGFTTFSMHQSVFESSIRKKWLAQQTLNIFECSMRQELHYDDICIKLRRAQSE